MDPEGRIGEVLDQRYRLWRIVGEGAFGHVYEAIDEHKKQSVAVKVLPPSFADDPEWMERFRREARAATRIGNPHIVAAMDLGRTPDGSAYLVLDLVDGPTLEEEIQREGRIPLGRAAAIGIQIADALGAAHGAGIVHRDMKPSNVVLERRSMGEFVRIVDFGIVKFFGPEGGDSPDLTTPGVFLGTPEYMAPEQAAGARIDGRADIFSLGVVLYQMLTGEIPHSGPGPVEILMAKAGERHRPLRERVPRIPPPVDALVDRMLAHTVGRRPKTMREVADALRPFAQVGIVTAPVVAARTTGARPSARPPSREGSTPTWLALLVLGALVVGGGYYWIWQATEPGPEQQLAMARTTVADRPDDATAHLALGEAYLVLGRREEAARAFRAALRLDPRLAAAREGLDRAQQERVR